MYQNRICRTTTNPQPRFFIPRSEIAFDERVSFVESVCATLIESRFGPGCVKPVFMDITGQLEIEPVDFLDLTDNRTRPCYAFSALGRAGCQVVESCLRAKQMGVANAGLNAYNSTAALSPNLGRGSPQTIQHRRSDVI